MEVAGLKIEYWVAAGAFIGTSIGAFVKAHRANKAAVAAATETRLQLGPTKEEAEQAGGAAEVATIRELVKTIQGDQRTNRDHFDNRLIQIDGRITDVDRRALQHDKRLERVEESLQEGDRKRDDIARSIGQVHVRLSKIEKTERVTQKIVSKKEPGR